MMKATKSVSNKKPVRRHRHVIWIMVFGTAYLILIYVTMSNLQSPLNYIAYPILSLAPFVIYLIFAGYIRALKIGSFSVDVDNADIINKQYDKASFEDFLSECQKPKPGEKSLRSPFDYLVVEIPFEEDNTNIAKLSSILKRRIDFYANNYKYIVFIRKGIFITAIDSQALRLLCESPELDIAISLVVKNQTGDMPIKFLNVFNGVYINDDSDALEILKKLQRRNKEFISITKSTGEFVGIATQRSIVNKMLIWISEYLMTSNKIEDD